MTAILRVCLALVVLSGLVVISRSADDRTTAPPMRFIDQGKYDRRLAGYRTPEGIQLEIVAEAPTVVHPLALAFADDGTPHVIEWTAEAEEPRLVKDTLRYRDGTTRIRTLLHKKKKDIIKALSSTRGTGVWDQAKVVVEDDLPTDLLFLDGWLYLAGQGKVWRCRPAKPGGAHDTREIIVQGFDTRPRSVSGLALGTDGWLYVSVAAGDHDVEGVDGSRAVLHETGGIFRCRPDGTKLHVFSAGLHYPAGPGAFDLGGNLFHLDIDSTPAGKPPACRLLHLAEKTDFGHRRGILRDRTRTESLPAMLRSAASKPSGLFFYHDNHFPEEYRGLLLASDARQQRIRAYRIEPAGASFRVSASFPFLSAAKDARFRPGPLVLGPDGALYLIDRRSTEDERQKKEPEPGRGRIYRIRWVGTKDNPAVPLRGMDSWAKVVKQKDEDLVLTLKGEQASDREKARQELVRRGARCRAALLKVLEAEESSAAARVQALAALQAMFHPEVQAAMLRILADSDGEAQRLAAEALGLWASKADRSVHNGLLAALSCEDAAVRRTVAIAMGRLAGPAAGDNLASTLSFDAGKDAYLRDGLVRGLEMLGKAGIDALVALADSGVQKDTDRVVEVFLTLRTRPAFAALPVVFRHRHVSAEQRAQLLRSCSNYRLTPPVSLDALVPLVATGKQPEVVQKALLDVLALPGTVKGARAVEWVTALLEAGAAGTAHDRTAQRQAIAVLGSTAAGARHAGTLLLEKKLPAQLQPEVTACLQRHAASDAEAARILARLRAAGR